PVLPRFSLFPYTTLFRSSLIAFTMTMGTILTIIFYVISFLVLLIIPSTYWREDVLKMKYAIKQSRKLMKMGEYPVGSHPDKMEKDRKSTRLNSSHVSISY